MADGGGVGHHFCDGSSGGGCGTSGCGDTGGGGGSSGDNVAYFGFDTCGGIAVSSGISAGNFKS